MSVEEEEFARSTKRYLQKLLLDGFSMAQAESKAKELVGAMSRAVRESFYER